MFKKVAAALLLGVLLSASTFGTALAEPDADKIVIKKGENSDYVILLQMRLRDLGYYNYKITGYFGDFTMDSLKEFQKNNSITADGIAGEKTLELIYSRTAKRKAVEPRVKPTVTTKKVKYGVIRDWFSYVNSRWKKGTKCKVVDFNTGKSYYMVRVGGQYHADVAPATKKDTQTFKATYGGDWSWDRRAVVVYIGGEAIAASANGMPHGSTGVKGNGMNLASGKLQQVCIHFKNSKTHVHNMVDPDHQYQMKRAAGVIK